MDEPLEARTLNELRYYLMVTPCAACGHGPMELADRTGETAEVVRCVRAVCNACGQSCEVRLAEPVAADVRAADAAPINPTDEPSRIVDLGQWLSLFYLLVESAATETSRPSTRRTGYRAALCLAEALKFYGDDELPPEEAFFSEASKAAFREHPESFARQRLAAMKARLPSLEVMHHRVQRDEDSTGRRWWQFWRK